MFAEDEHYMHSQFNLTDFRFVHPFGFKDCHFIFLTIMLQQSSLGSAIHVQWRQATAQNTI
jgi:hypothetical protein